MDSASVATAENAVITATTVSSRFAMPSGSLRNGIDDRFPMAFDYCRACRSASAASGRDQPEVDLIDPFVLVRNLDEQDA
jgi:hypothetical protein